MNLWTAPNQGPKFISDEVKHNNSSCLHVRTHNLSWVTLTVISSVILIFQYVKSERMPRHIKSYILLIPGWLVKQFIFIMTDKHVDASGCFPLYLMVINLIMSIYEKSSFTPICSTVSGALQNNHIFFTLMPDLIWSPSVSLLCCDKSG